LDSRAHPLSRLCALLAALLLSCARPGAAQVPAATGSPAWRSYPSYESLPSLLVSLGDFAAIVGVASGLLGLLFATSGDGGPKCNVQVASATGFGLMGVSILLLVLGMNPPDRLRRVIVPQIMLGPRSIVLGGTW
jgi:hypothetical protein